MKAHALVSRLSFDDVEFPFLCLLISGGHGILCIVKSAERFEILGQTANISPGEAIDKVARAAGIIPTTHYGGVVEEYAKRWVVTFNKFYLQVLDQANFYPT
jgi:N6-L-threonylcarbamoyladenine synthase